MATNGCSSPVLKQAPPCFHIFLTFSVFFLFFPLYRLLSFLFSSSFLLSFKTSQPPVFIYFFFIIIFMGTLGTTGMIIKLKLLLESMKYMYWKRKNSITSLSLLLNLARVDPAREPGPGCYGSTRINSGQPGLTRKN